MAGRWRPGTVEGNDGGRVRTWTRGDWIIAQDVNIGAHHGAPDRWGFSLSYGDLLADVETEHGTGVWATRREAMFAAGGDPPLLDAATVRARRTAATHAALNRHVRRLAERLQADPVTEPDSVRVAADAGPVIADLAALAEHLGARRSGAAAVEAALLFVCESEVSVVERPASVALVFDAGREWSREVVLTWPLSERAWTREIDRADSACTEARERHEEKS